MAGLVGKRDVDWNMKRKKQHGIFIGKVLESVIAGSVAPDQPAEFKKNLLTYIAEDQATIKETVKTINEYSKKLKEEYPASEKRGIERAEKHFTEQKKIQQSVLVIDNELMKLLDGGVDQPHMSAIINNAQEHQKTTEENDRARDERFETQKKMKMKLPPGGLKQPFVGGPYDQCDSDSCTSSGSDD